MERPMRIKSKIALIIAVFCVFLCFLPSLGCRKKREPPRPTPVPTNTPVPHMEKIVYTYNGNLLWMNTDGSGREILFPDSNSKWYPSVSPDGWYVIYWVQTSEYYNLWLGDFKSGKASQITFDQVTLEGDVQNFSIGNSVSWTKDSGSVIYSRNKDIWRMTRDGFNQEALTGTHDAISPALSLDNKLVFSKLEKDDTSNLYIKDVNSFSEMKLTKLMGKKAGSPCFSPDGTRVVYTVTDSDNVDIYIVDASTGNEQQLTFDGKSNSPGFSYDGSKIVFSSFVGDKYQPDIWMMNMDKSEKVKITKEGGVSPSWLYRILAEPLPTFTPVPEEGKPKQQEENIMNAPAAAGTTPEAAPVATEAPVAPAQVEGELAVKLIKQGDKLMFYPVIHFDVAVANIKQEFYPVLDDMVKIISKYSSPIVIDGHTDNSPIRKRYPNNQALSEARAKAVKKYLVNKGISAKRIRTEGFGESRPLVPNDTEDNKYKNRRAEIHIKIMQAEEAKANADIATPTPAATDTPTAVPTATPTPTPKNIFEQLFKPKGKKPKAAGW
jgi:outer membrane protein OmpA-like peptidoglycan-associated protein